MKYYLLILLLSLLFCFNTLGFAAIPQTYDTTAHLASIVQFEQVFKYGQFPIVWVQNYANYGYPLGLIAHQSPIYLGAVLLHLTQNLTLSFGLLIFTATFFSSAFFYKFLSLRFASIVAFVATLVFMFNPYRILNVYIRGALPEHFASIFLPLILILIHNMQDKPRLKIGALLGVSVAGLLLTHPMMALVFAPIVVAYIFVLRPNISTLIQIAAWSTLGLCLGAYYIVPLFAETKYFLLGGFKPVFEPHMGISWGNIFRFSIRTDCGSNFAQIRCHDVILGFFEVVTMCVTLLAISIGVLCKKLYRLQVVFFVVGVFLVFVSSHLASGIYNNIRVIGSMQFLWRFLNAFSFVSPVLLAILLSQFKNKKYAVIAGLIVAVTVLYFGLSNVHAKNYRSYTVNEFLFLNGNMYHNLLIPIWAESTDKYKVSRMLAEIVEGDGEIVARHIANSVHRYEISAKTKVRVRENTFYFPGWQVFVDGRQTDIEFQDPTHRGVITYFVPEGSHEVVVKFEDTKIRLVSKIVSAAALIFVLVIIIYARYSRQNSQNQQHR